MENKLGMALNDLLAGTSLDLEFILQEAFLGYKWRKQSNNLYNSDVDIPKKLIELYYLSVGNHANFDVVKKTFMNKYIRNESALEGVHTKEEKEGFEKMYEYIHSDEIEYMFNVYTLKDLHEKLYSCVPYPEVGGVFRTADARLSKYIIGITEWSEIRSKLNELDVEVQSLLEMANYVKVDKEIDKLFEFIERTVKLQCDLIKIHPFFDGNGRTIRGFTNKIFESVGLPPVYINKSEKQEYLDALHETVVNENYDLITKFYFYKICDSIIELDINERVKAQRETAKVKTLNYNNKTKNKQKN